MRLVLFFTLAALNSIFAVKIPQIPQGVLIPQVNPRFFDSVPKVSISSDSNYLNVVAVTRVPTPPGILYYGNLEPNKRARYRFYSREVSQDPTQFTTVHNFSFALNSHKWTSLEYPSYDVSNLSREGGVISLRVVFYNSESQEHEQMDWEIRYRKNSDGTRVLEPAMDSGPFLDMHRPDHAVLSINFRETATARLSIAKSPCTTYQGKILSGIKVEAEFFNLEPETSYCAKAEILNSDGSYFLHETWKFETLSFEPKPLRFVVMGDSRSANGGGEHNVQGLNQKAIEKFFNLAYRSGARFVVFPGDLIDGYTSDLERLKLSFRTFHRASGHHRHEMPLFAGMGNHESFVHRFPAPKGGPKPWKGSNFTLPQTSPYVEEVFAQELVSPRNGPEPEADGLPPYMENVYSFIMNGVGFVMLNSNYWYCSDPETLGGNLEGYIMDKQLAWLNQTVEEKHKHEKVRHILYFIHEPIFPNSVHQADSMWFNGGLPEKNGGIDRGYVITRRNEILKAISSSPKSRAVFHGHEHNYSKTLIPANEEMGVTHPLWQIVSGGLGSPYYAQLKDVPWANQVKVFNWSENFIVLDSDEASIRLEAFDGYGNSIDAQDLMVTE